MAPQTTRPIRTDSADTITSPMMRSNLSVVCRRRNAASVTGPVGVEEFATGLVDALIGMRAEVVALRLQQVRRQPSGSIAIEERQGGCERRRGNAHFDCPLQRLAPTILILVQYAREEAVQKQIAQVGSGDERFLDLAQETAADDTAPAPHQRDATHVQ